MSFKFPFTNYHELNLTWVLDQLKKLFEESAENVSTIQNYDGRLTAVETELPTVAENASEASRAAAAAGTLAQSAKATANTAQENAIQAQRDAGTAQNTAERAQTAADAATQAAQQAQATAQNFDGRITQAENYAASALEASRSFENRVQAAITTANNAAQTATNAQGIATRADQNAGTALDRIGNLSALDTVAKQNLVVAINEALENGGKVDSVNGQTGAVVLDAGDIGYNDSTVETALDGKQNAPTAVGTVGQVLGLNSALEPVWINQSEGGDCSNCAPLIINTASGAVATFLDGADNMKIRKIIGTIETEEGGNGWTEAHIIRAGRNLAIGQVIKDVVFDNVESSRRGYNENTGWLWFQPPANGRYPTIIGADSPNPISKIIFKAATRYTIIFEVTSQDNDNYFNIAVAYTDGTTYEFTSSEKVSGKIIYTTPAGKTLKNIYIGYYVNKWTSINCNTFGVYEGIVAENEQQEQGVVIPINWNTEAGLILNGTVTLNEDGSADILNSDSGVSYHIAEAGTLNTFLGVNNVRIDTGSITECLYPADTKLYIDGKIAELQALALENNG